MLILHQYRMSPYNEKLQRMLRYKDVAVSEQYWSVAQRGEVKKHNPTGKLPALEHEGKWICDSAWKNKCYY